MLKLFNKKRSSHALQETLTGYELPSFPSVVMSVLDMLRDPDVPMSDVAQELQADPGIHVKVLRTVNSAAFGLATKVSNLHHAVTLLGRSRIESLVLSLAIKDTLPNPTLPNFDFQRYWQAATQRASLARYLAQNLHPNTTAESFSAGLLQDMAIPVIASVKSASYSPLLENWLNDDSVRLDRLEQEAFGYDHASVGSLMAKEWNLPETIVQSIADHHKDPSETSIEPAVLIASHIRQGDSARDKSKIVQLCQEALGEDEEKIISAIEQAYEDADTFCKFLH